jgi:hypothetical protein
LDSVSPFLIIKQSVELIERGISPSQGRYLFTTSNFKAEKAVHALDRVAAMMGSFPLSARLADVTKRATTFFLHKTFTLLNFKLITFHEILLFIIRKENYPCNRPRRPLGL